MLRAVFVRTLKAGVSYEQFKDAWAPLDTGAAYPAVVRVAANVTNDRQVMTVIELDMPADEFEQARPTLTRPDARERLAEIIESTQLEGLFEDVFDESSL